MPSFQIFRYQILPNNRNFQGSIYDGKTVNDVIAEKNAIFWEALTSIEPFATRRKATTTQKLAMSEDFAVFRTGVGKKLLRNTPDFKTEKIDTWPHVLVVLWNDPDRQYIAIQHNPSAFTTPGTVLNTLQRNINRELAVYQLAMYSKPVFDKRDFWSLIAQNRNLIEAVEFAFLTPNMASISRSLNESLKEFAKASNSVENKLELKANKGAVLTLMKSDDQTAGLVDYSSRGGGEIHIKLRGIRKRVTVGNAVKEVDIGEIDFESTKAEEVKSMLSRIFND